MSNSGNEGNGVSSHDYPSRRPTLQRSAHSSTAAEDRRVLGSPPAFLVTQRRPLGTADHLAPVGADTYSSQVLVSSSHLPGLKLPFTSDFAPSPVSGVFVPLPVLRWSYLAQVCLEIVFELSLALNPRSLAPITQELATDVCPMPDSLSLGLADLQAPCPPFFSADILLAICVDKFCFNMT